MKLKLSGDREIDLPMHYDESERLELVRRIIEDYPEEFSYQEKMFDTKYGQRQDINKIVKIKLDILGTYLIKSDKEYNKDVMTRYKEKKRPEQEMSFSQISADLIDAKGWY
jgi:hypothetical protein